MRATALPLFARHGPVDYTEIVTDRLDRIEATLEQTALAQARTAGNLDRLTGVVATLADSVVAHDELMEQLAKSMSELKHQWQAYLSTIHPRQ
jgi:ABC-type transporter Mla subunit MlaD